MSKFTLVLLVFCTIACKTERTTGTQQSFVKESEVELFSAANDKNIIPQMSPETKVFISRLKELAFQPDQKMIEKYALRKINGEYHAGAILTCGTEDFEEELNKEKVIISSVNLNFLTVKIPVSAFNNIASWHTIDYIKIDRALNSR